MEEDIQPQINKARTETFWLTLGFAFFFVRPLIEVFADAAPKRKNTNITSAKNAVNTYPTTRTLNQTSQTQSNEQTLKFIDYRNSVLILIFKPGGEYHYQDVPEYIYNGLLEATSKEQYFYDNIKGKYPTF